MHCGWRTAVVGRKTVDTATDQIELRWTTPSGRLNPHMFRNAVGFAVGATARNADWGWMFNDVASQPGPGAIAPVRFITGRNHAGSFASIVAVGRDACMRLSAALMLLLPAMRTVEGLAGHADVRFGRTWWKPSEGSNAFRVHTLVLNRVKGDRAKYDALRADPTPMTPLIQDAIAQGLDRMADRIGIEKPGIASEQIEVVSIGTLSAQPVGPSGRGMRSRLTHAVIRMPIRLEGDWRVGGLVGYGNGGIAEIAKERHWRSDESAQHPHPKYPRQAA